MQRLAAEQRNLEEQQRRQHEAAAAELRRSQNHEVNANASPDVKQTLKVSWTFVRFLMMKVLLIKFPFQTFLIQKQIEKERNQNSSWNRNL